MSLATDPRFPARTEAPPGPTACSHCGLPVPAGLLQPHRPQQFCCAGCEVVYGAIQAGGLGAYYRIRDPQQSRPAVVRADSFTELDDDAFLVRYARAQGTLRSIEMVLEGVHCSACVWLVERALAAIPGVAEARLNLSRATLELVWDPQKVALSQIGRRLAQLGYVPHPKERGRTEEARTRQERALLLRMGVAAACMGNTMLIAIALYAGWFNGIEAEWERFFRWLSLGVSVPAVLYAAQPFFTSAYQGLRNRVLHMDLPLAIGVGAGFAGSALNTLRGAGEIYFDSVTTLIFLLLVGRFLQLRQQHRAADRSELLGALAPVAASLIPPGALAADPAARQRVTVHRLRAGDRVWVDSGERIPADGVILAGRSAIDASLLTGEATPVAVQPGDDVWGGTTNTGEPLVVELRADLDTSRVGQIAGLVHEAVRGRSPVVRLADRLASWFVGGVLALSTFTLTLWCILEPAMALDHTIALLVVSCPCALGLATPLAIAAALHQAARRGILVRSGGAVERLGTTRGGHIWFDKTGTLTRGRMEVVEYITAHPQAGNTLRAYIRALERGVSHPLGKALRTWAGPGPALLVSNRTQVPGGGLEGNIHGRRVRLGSPRWTAPADIPEHAQRQTEQWTQRGLTPIWLVVDGSWRGAVALFDPLKADAAQEVARLRELGFTVGILSGDHPGAVARVAEALGIESGQARGGLTPEDKLAAVQRTRAAGHTVLMVGDGVNDAAALAAADVGVALHGGAEACLTAADAFLQNPEVRGIGTLISGSRTTMRTIRNNIIFSASYNVVCATLAVAGLLSPLLAAVLMPLSSLIVVSRSYRFRFAETPKS